MVATKQKSMIDAQKIKRKESKHSTMEDHHSQRKTAREKGQGNRELQKSQKTINKMAVNKMGLLIKNYFKYKWIKFSN